MKGRTPVFMLHRLDQPSNLVCGHTVDFVRSSLSALRESGAKFVSLSTLVDAWTHDSPIDPDWVVFTIDDGFADQEILVREAFAPLGCPVTIFLITGFLDGQLWPWDDQLAYLFMHADSQDRRVEIGSRQFSLSLTDAASRNAALHVIREFFKMTAGLDPYSTARKLADDLGVSLTVHPPHHFRPMTWDAARKLEREKMAEFGPHTVSHRILSTISAEASRGELQQSWDRLQQELANPQPILAWPTGRSGDFEDKDIANARDIGLRASVITDPGYARKQAGGSADQLFRMQRFAMPHNINTVLRYGSWLERGRELLPL
jgi:peptidoglycan/xylan/chitin deacetylase (PgdA/CDA1 family)